MCKVIMIDDNPMEHMIVQRMCKRYHLFRDIVHSLDGRQILDFIRCNRWEPNLLPDIIFLDLNMPLLSGWEFLEYFQELNASVKKQINIYIVSSSIDNSDRSIPDRYTFVKGFLCKPLMKETLLNLYNIHSSEKRMAS